MWGPNWLNGATFYWKTFDLGSHTDCVGPLLLGPFPPTPLHFALHSDWCRS